MFKVQKRGDTAYISTTDLARNIKAVYEEALPDHGRLVVETNNEPVMVISLPDNVDTDVETFTYGEQE